MDRPSIVWQSNLWQNEISSKLWLYGCTTWMPMKLKKKVKWELQRILSAILNKSWKQYLHKSAAVQPLSFISQTIQVRWARHSEHCWRNKDELISYILQWTPTTGHTSIDDQQKLTFICSVQSRSNEWLGWMARIRKLHSINTTWWAYKL